jgi:hypothetical protein
MCRHSPVWGSQILLVTVSHQILLETKQTYAEKSAEPVAAMAASDDSLEDQTAPLCPIKVPIQSPVMPSRSMGLLSVLVRIYSQGLGKHVPLHAEMR